MKTSSEPHGHWVTDTPNTTQKGMSRPNGPAATDCEPKMTTVEPKFLHRIWGQWADHLPMISNQNVPWRLSSSKAQLLRFQQTRTLERPLFNFVHLQFAPLFSSNVHFFTVPFSLISLWVRRASRKNSPSNSWRSEGNKRVYYIHLYTCSFLSIFFFCVSWTYLPAIQGRSTWRLQRLIEPGSGVEKNRLPRRRPPHDPWPLYHHLGNQAINTNRSECECCRDILDVLDLFEYLMIFTEKISIFWRCLWVVSQVTQRPGALLALTQQGHLVIRWWLCHVLIICISFELCADMCG